MVRGLSAHVHCIPVHAITHLPDVGVFVERESSIYFGRDTTRDDLKDFTSEFDELLRFVQCRGNVQAGAGERGRREKRGSGVSVNVSYGASEEWKWTVLTSRSRQASV
jgi:hypothetical protein